MTPKPNTPPDPGPHPFEVWVVIDDSKSYRVGRTRDEALEIYHDEVEDRNRVYRLVRLTVKARLPLPLFATVEIPGEADDGQEHDLKIEIPG